MSGSAQMEVTWTDPVTGRHGYLVVDKFVRGLTSGGFRVREGLTLDEVRGLARTMSDKEALVYDPDDRYLPFGGAKGGVDAPPGSREADAMTRRFFADLLPVVSRQWVTGEDFGTRQEDLDAAVASLGLSTTIGAVFNRLDDPEAARHRLSEALAVHVDGIPLAELVGGYGVAEVAVAWAEHAGLEPKQLTAAVQGFGSIGGAAARYLTQAGVRVVGVADRDGLVYNPDGLDVERLLSSRASDGRIDRTALCEPERVLPGEQWLSLPVDLLVPAAVSYTISAETVPDITARCVVEGANLPTLPDAEAELAARDVPVIPDFLANVATNAWWWWVTFGDVEPAAEAGFAKISRTMRRLVDSATSEAAQGGNTLREAALTIANANSTRLEQRTADGTAAAKSG